MSKVTPDPFPFFSAFKRTVGGALSARQPASQLAEAAIRVLTYALRR